MNMTSTSGVCCKENMWHNLDWASNEFGLGGQTISRKNRNYFKKIKGLFWKKQLLSDQ